MVLLLPGDVKAVIANNITTFTSLLLHIRDNGRVLLSYALYSLYTALRYMHALLVFSYCVMI